MQLDNNQQTFFELIRVALGTHNKLSRNPSSKEWEQIFNEAERQAVSGLVVEGIEKLQQEQRPEQLMLLEWIGVVQMVRYQNELLNKRSAEIQNVFLTSGFRSCILKGQGNAQMYPNPTCRMPGDIDIWLEGERQAITEFVESIAPDAHKGYKDVSFHYKDVEVEAHYFPTYLNSYPKNKHLQRYIEENKEKQFANFVDIEEGRKLCVPTDDFNVVYQMCHLYHHFFCEGIGLRHFIDYFFLLKRLWNVDDSVRENAKRQFQTLGMERFAKGVMWIEKEVLGLERECLLVEADVKTGKLILKEINEYGNFNKADMEGKSVTASKLSNTFRPFKYLLQFPKESVDRILFLGRLQLWKLKNKWMWFRKSMLQSV